MITIHRYSRLARVPDKMSIEIHAVLSPPGLTYRKQKSLVVLFPTESRIGPRSECRHNSRRVAIENDLQFFGRVSSTWTGSSRYFSSSQARFAKFRARKGKITRGLFSFRFAVVAIYVCQISSNLFFFLSRVSYLHLFMFQWNFKIDAVKLYLILRGVEKINIFEFLPRL